MPRRRYDDSPTDVAIALSLYAYNVSAQDRARRIFDDLDGWPVPPIR